MFLIGLNLRRADPARCESHHCKSRDKRPAGRLSPRRGRCLQQINTPCCLSRRWANVCVRGAMLWCALLFCYFPLRSGWTALTMPVVTTPSMERRACRPITSTPSSALVTRRRYGPAQATWVSWRELISWMQAEVKKGPLIMQEGRETFFSSLSENDCVLPDLRPLDRHDALFVVGSLDETLELRGLRYHPIDIETSVSRAHRSIAER